MATIVLAPAYGGPDVLTFAERDLVDAGPGEVAVEAAGVVTAVGDGAP